MPITQDNIGPGTPLGANLTAGGATFRLWAPNATAVHLKLNASPPPWQPDASNLLSPGADGVWSGFVPGAKDGDLYRFYVVGKGSQGLKRDPHARELVRAGYPDCDCVVRDPNTYPWHDGAYRPPAFNDLIVYQFHIGAFYAADAQGRDERKNRVGTFLDVLDRVKYLADLGVNAVEPLPVVEFPTDRSLGYNGVDLFSPEMLYTVAEADLERYRAKLNQLLAGRGCGPVSAGELAPQVNQLKALVDVCHLYGLAVVLDVVYNHAGGGFDDQSLWFLDRQPNGDKNHSLYFTDREESGGQVFAFWNRDVWRFLLANADLFLREYHADGFRYDQVSVIVKNNVNDGWPFCQALTDAVRAAKPAAVQVAEYWRDWGGPSVDPYVVRGRGEGGAGFDATWHDGLRETIRNAVGQAAAGGRDGRVNLDPVRDNLSPPGFPAAWKAVQYVESHDEVYWDPWKHEVRAPRIPRLADGLDPRSWYARSRARVATGLVLTAPGVPMLFMGQEFLEDQPWNDDAAGHPEYLIGWEGLDPAHPDGPRVDYLRFTRELAWLRRRHPALRGEGINPYYAHDDNRVLAFQRWVEGVGRDVVVVASLNESTWWNYELGFPQPGHWHEVFNSDAYDSLPAGGGYNPRAAGNPGGLDANGPPRDGMPFSAALTIPANGLLVFARDRGDS